MCKECLIIFCRCTHIVLSSRPLEKQTLGHTRISTRVSMSATGRTHQSQRILSPRYSREDLQHNVAVCSDAFCSSDIIFFRWNFFPHARQCVLSLRCQCHVNRLDSLISRPISSASLKRPQIIVLNDVGLYVAIRLRINWVLIPA